MAEVIQPAGAIGAEGGRNAVIAVGDSMTADILLKSLKICHFGSIFVVHEFGQARAMIEEAREPVDLLICDLRLADGDVFQLISELSRRKFAGALIFLTAGSPVLLNCAADLAEAGDLHVLATYSHPLSVRALVDLLKCQLFGQETESAEADPRIDASVLARDMANWQIEAVYQPKVSLGHGAIVGFEALARWNHTEYGLIPPAYFLSRAEQQLLIDDLTCEVLTQSLRMLEDVLDFVPLARMAVNLSGRSLQDPRLPDRLLAIVEDHGIRPAQLIFEITETQIVRNRSGAVSSVNRLGLMGFGISLDDFGTGFSSLDRLKSMPFTELKVDRRFCHGASRRPRLVHILRNCHDLARDLGLTIVAEGIEDEADRELVQELDFDIVQGYCVSRAIRGPQVLDWIEAYGLEGSEQGHTA